LLVPRAWPEPSGVVMIEGMACGTPVIAFRSGSVPEVIDHGVSGFMVDSEEDAIQAVKALGELDRLKVRSQFERRFTANRMAEGYVGHYQALLEAKRLRQPSNPETVTRHMETRISAHEFFRSLGPHQEDSLE